MKKLFFIVFLTALLGLSFGLIADEAMASPCGKTYDIWVSQSFGVPPYTPFHDCLSFNAACTQATLAVCGPAGVAVQGGAPVGDHLFIIDCGGLSILGVGKDIDGVGIGFAANTLGGVMAGITEQTTFGYEGIENAACAPYAGDGANYSQ
jgi:hypothetical protein